MSGFIGSLINGASNLLSNPNIDASLINAGSKLAGGLIASNANSNAANTAANGAVDAARIQADANQKAIQQELDAQSQARAEMRAASQRGLGDIMQGLSQYESTVNPLLTPNPITIPTYRDLTPQQQTGEQDLLRNGEATLAASGLRGAGRAGVGALMDQDRRYQEDVRAQNDADTRGELRRAQGVANAARQGLASTQAQAGGSLANTELETGNQLGSSYQQGGAISSGITQQTGAAQGNAATSAANTQANATLANGQVYGSTLGGLSAITADALAPYGAIGANPASSYQATDAGGVGLY